jgi:hypothetical protein
VSARLHLRMKSHVTQDSPNESIPIFDGPLAFIEEEITSDERGSIAYDLATGCRLSVSVPMPTRYIGGTQSECSVLPKGADSSCKALITKAGLTWSEEAGESIASPVSGLLKGTVSFGASEPMGRVRFHLANFLTYRGEQIFNPRSEVDQIRWFGRTSFDMGPWRVTLDALPHASERLRHATAVSGNIITHVGNLERKSDSDSLGKLFSFDQARKALEVLYFVFTFANGARCPCLLPYGLRHMPSEVSRWVDGEMRLAPAGPSHTWFALEHPDASFSFADRLYHLWSIEDERSWLSFAINIYAEANRNLSGVDIELAKSQIALELLASEALQERQLVISSDNFARLSAADRIRLALLWAGVPAYIPQSMKELLDALHVLKGEESGPFDGPFAITQIRNATVHATRPKRNRMSKLDDWVRFQAWQLSQSYVALLILRLLDYKGPYLPHYRGRRGGGLSAESRLWLMVPWVKS